MATNSYEYRVTYYNEDDEYSQSEIIVIDADDQVTARDLAHKHVEDEGYCNFGDYDITLMDAY
jgi:hypothetical protein